MSIEFVVAFPFIMNSTSIIKSESFTTPSLLISYVKAEFILNFIATGLWSETF